MAKFRKLSNLLIPRFLNLNNNQLSFNHYYASIVKVEQKGIVHRSPL